MFQGKQSNNPLSFIAQSCTIKGKLSFSGDVLIAGTVEGDLSTSGNVVIEATGKVIGQIHAKELSISGRVEGEAHCHKVSLTPNGNFNGDIHSEKLEIIEGGQFLGQRHLPKAKPKAKTGSSGNKDTSTQATKETSLTAD